MSENCKESGELPPSVVWQKHVQKDEEAIIRTDSRGRVKIVIVKRAGLDHNKTTH